MAPARLRGTVPLLNQYNQYNQSTPPMYCLPMKVLTRDGSVSAGCAGSINRDLSGGALRLPATRTGGARVCAAVFAALAWWIMAAPVVAADSCGDRLQDEIWLVSARQVGCVQSGEAPPLQAQRYRSETGWEAVEVGEIYQPAAPDQIVVVYVHGNRVASNEVAGCEGRYVYRLLTAQVDDPVSLRFVIWSWPSAQVQGQLRDVRVKAQRTDLGGYCLGWFLTQFPEQQRVSLLGYSFGARIATGALHLIGGGQIAGRSLPPHDGGTHHARVVLLAAALHNNWLRPGCYHEHALAHTDYLLNLYDCCDPVLKWYPKLYKRSHTQALGFSGMYTGGLGRRCSSD